ncbi:unnamed protein product [Medioppia subpectinata]|uniref:Cytochrome P450 n=1 Tax=Medioppia subpectinata TaxID=1979941 RepID=A0A7R9KMI1_9ACAR|nr:unnamed protein product [Medioppia subpectinata]CAG2106249.1 unnamed protein product [Medioppia subpectinata]
MGAKATVLVADADVAKDIQIKDFHNFTDRANLKLKGGPFGDSRFDESFLILRGKRWKKVRSVSTPTFSASKLKTMTPIIDDAFKNFIHIIDKRSKTGHEFDIYGNENEVQINAQNKDTNDLKDSKQHKNEISLTDSEVLANSTTLYLAGYETTSTALGYMSHIFVKYPDIQERVRQEVQKLQESDGILDYNTVQKLDFMDCVLKETFRFYSPIVTFVARECHEDYKLNDTIVIPKGSSVVVDVHYLHYSPDYCCEPEVFDPMRFSADRKHEIYPNSWQPFGSGPRNCIGMRFALLVVKLSLVKLLLNYRLISGAKTETANFSLTTTIFTQSPSNGIFLKVAQL